MRSPRSPSSPPVVTVGDASADIVAAWARRGRRLAVQGGPATRVWAEGTGPPIVLLHGVPASAFLYRKVLPELARRGHRAIAFDLPGLGLSDTPSADMALTWPVLSSWTLSAIDALGLGRFGLVVHDIGGPIGFDVVRRAPDRVASLTALNTWVATATVRRPWVMAPFAVPGAGRLWLAGMRGANFELFVRRYGVRSMVPSDELRAYVRLVKHGDGGKAFLRLMRSWDRTRSFEEAILQALRERNFPAQVVWGEDDVFLPVDRHGEQLRRVLGVDHVERLPGSHFVQEDSPAALAELVTTLTG